MSWSIYQVSKVQTVLTFRQNQKEPNKVGVALTEKMRDLVRDGVSFPEALAELRKMHTEFKEKNVRGIDSVNLSYHESDNSNTEQGHQSIYLSYKLNGTFATYTEYLPLKIKLK